MVELLDIVCQAGPAYRRAFETRMLPSHRRALDDLCACRTPELGGSLFAFDAGCGHLDFAYHSCRNRHCPKGHRDDTRRWLEGLRTRLLPCPYYLATFTLPAELRALTAPEAPLSLLSSGSPGAGALVVHAEPRARRLPVCHLPGPTAMTSRSTTSPWPKPVRALARTQGPPVSALPIGLLNAPGPSRPRRLPTEKALGALLPDSATLSRAPLLPPLSTLLRPCRRSNTQGS